MIKTTSIILVLNLFLFSGIANAEEASANVQEGTNEPGNTPISDTGDAAQPEKQVIPNERISDEAKSGQINAAKEEAAKKKAKAAADAFEKTMKKQKSRLYGGSGLGPYGFNYGENQTGSAE